MDQDTVGWDRFVMGMVSSEFHDIQVKHLAFSSSHLSAMEWMKTFITHLLQLSHCQWIYQNKPVHNKVTGTNARREKELLRSQIDAEMEWGVEYLLPSDCCLMDIEMKNLQDTNGEHHTYGLLAVETAHIVGEMMSLLAQGIG